MKKPSRFYTWYGKVYWTYWTKYTWYNNPHFGNEEWHCWEEWAVFIGLKPKDSKWFGFESSYYDGHTVAMVIVCGLVFGKLYSYDAQPVTPDAA